MKNKLWMIIGVALVIIVIGGTLFINNSDHSSDVTVIPFPASESEEDYNNEVVAVANNNDEYEAFLKLNDIDIIEKIDFKQYKVAFVKISTNSCGEKVTYKSFHNNTLKFSVNNLCGYCAMLSELYIIKVKSHNNLDLNSLQIKFSTISNKDCDFYEEKKPILYLYPVEDNTKIEVEFSNKDLLTTTYPKYEDKWVVYANVNGDLHDLNGNYYYGLYWEENNNKKVDFKEGFYVTKEESILFLEENLSLLGLNDKERNEFIMYWLPILEKNEKSIVYFELTDELEKYNPIIISPRPDSLLRIIMHVKKVEKETSIKKQKLPTFERVGFTAVEWGGVIY